MVNREQQEVLMNKILEKEGIIFKICNTYCKNTSDHPDLAQEIIYQLLKSYPRYNPEYKFTTWMYRVALNVAISFYRKAKMKKEVALTELKKESVDSNEVSLVTQLNLNILDQYINELKELDKALMLLYLESKSYKEISEILGITETNVATKISRIKNVLKQKFSNHKFNVK